MAISFQNPSQRPPIGAQGAYAGLRIAGELLAALVGYIGRKTREDIIRRTAAGRERAKAKGVKFGRRPKLSSGQREEALARRCAGETNRAIARSFNVSPSTISSCQCFVSF